MMVILTKPEYDELIKQATAAELLAEEKANQMKKQIKQQLIAVIKPGRFVTLHDVVGELQEILRHY